MFLVQSQVGILQIMELLEYDGRTNNHGDCDHELHANQPFDQCPFLTGRLPSLESQQRTERRHIESRERPCQATDPDNTEQDKQQRLPIELQRDILPDKQIEKRQQQFRQCQRQQQRDKSLHQTFRQELHDQLVLFRPGHFPDSDLFRPQGGTRRRQSHKVECPHKDDQDSQHRKEVNLLYIAMIEHIVRFFERCTQMNVFQRLESERLSPLRMFHPDIAHG